jgi:hypothetical protein
MQARNPENSYRIESYVDQSETAGVDSNSGELFSLTISDSVPIQQDAECGSNLEVDAVLRFSGPNPLLRLLSASGAKIHLAHPLKSGDPRIEKNEHGRGGSLEQVP